MRWLVRVIVGLVAAAAIAFAVLLPSGFTCPEGSALFVQRSHSSGEVVHGCLEAHASNGFELSRPMDAKKRSAVDAACGCSGDRTVLAGGLMFLEASPKAPISCSGLEATWW
jgi:hypothetical protein